MEMVKCDEMEMEMKYGNGVEGLEKCLSMESSEEGE
jgi:hypothetical protein